jgi:hypothetical protein
MHTTTGRNLVNLKIGEWKEEWRNAMQEGTREGLEMEGHL